MATITVKVDDDLKRDVEREFKAMGLTLSSGINIYLNQVRDNHGIPFELKNIRNSFENDPQYRPLPRSRRARRHVISMKNGKMHIPNTFPKELEEAWEL